MVSVMFKMDFVFFVWFILSLLLTVDFCLCYLLTGNMFFFKKKVKGTKHNNNEERKESILSSLLAACCVLFPPLISIAMRDFLSCLVQSFNKKKLFSVPVVFSMTVFHLCFSCLCVYYGLWRIRLLGLLWLLCFFLFAPSCYVFIAPYFQSHIGLVTSGVDIFNQAFRFCLPSSCLFWSLVGIVFLARLLDYFICLFILYGFTSSPCPSCYECVIWLGGGCPS